MSRTILKSGTRSFPSCSAQSSQNQCQAQSLLPTGQLPDTGWHSPAAVIPHCGDTPTLKPYGSVGFQIYQEAEEDGSGDVAAGGADRLFSLPLCSRCCIAFSKSFW
jgi:hypothetical protein